MLKPFILFRNKVIKGGSKFYSVQADIDFKLIAHILKIF